MSIQLSLIYPESPIRLQKDKEATFLINSTSTVQEYISIYIYSYEDESFKYIKDILINVGRLDYLIFWVANILKGKYCLACYKYHWFSKELFWKSPTFDIV